MTKSVSGLPGAGSPSEEGGGSGKDGKKKDKSRSTSSSSNKKAEKDSGALSATVNTAANASVNNSATAAPTIPSYNANNSGGDTSVCNSNNSGGAAQDSSVTSKAASRRVSLGVGIQPSGTGGSALGSSDNAYDGAGSCTDDPHSLCHTDGGVTSADDARPRGQRSNQRSSRETQQVNLGGTGSSGGNMNLLTLNAELEAEFSLQARNSRSSRSGNESDATITVH